MNSHLLVGKVVHRRSSPRRYELEHDVWYVALDLDELDEVQRRTWLIRRNRRALLEFRDRDYLPIAATDVACDIRAHLRREGVELPAGRITLITNLRVLGYQFNPASFYLCRDAGGSLAAVVLEVHNTFGERHLYTLRQAPSDERRHVIRGAMGKAFYVSPFIGPHGRYGVTVRDDADGVSIGINERVDGQPLLATSLSLHRLPLTSRTLTRLLLRYPLITHKTIALIHYHALRLWLRGIPWHRHLPSPSTAPRVSATIGAHGGGR